MILYFQKALKRLVRVEIEEQSQELDIMEEIVKKTVNANTKNAFRSYFYKRKTDQ